MFNQIVSILFCLLFIVNSANSLECFLKKHTIDFKILQTEIDLMWEKNYAPVGIEVIENGKDRGIWVLYIDSRGIDYRNWSVSRYDNPETLKNDILLAFQEDWVPLDLSITKKFGYILYLKQKHNSTDWQIQSADNLADLSVLIGKLALKDFIPIGLSVDSGEIVIQFIKVTNHSVRNWKLMEYSSQNDLETDLNNLTGNGWEPCGFMFWNKKFTVLLLN